MDGLLPPKRTPQFGTAEQVEHRNAWCHCPDLRPSGGGAVGGRQQHSRRPGAEPRLDPLETGHGLAGAPRKPDEVQTPAGKNPLHPFAKTGIHGDGFPGSAGEKTLGARCIYHIPTGAQPKTPPRQPALGIGDDLAPRPDDETQQVLLGAHGAGNKAAAQGAGIVQTFAAGSRFPPPLDG